MSYNETAEIHIKNVPRSVDKQRWFKFVNKHVNNKKWVKHYKDRNEWIITVKKEEKQEWKSDLTNKKIDGTRITVYIKSCHRQSAFHHKRNDKHFRTSSNRNDKYNNKYNKCFTKHLSAKQRDDMLSLCSKRYSSENKMLNLSGIITTEQESWASFSNTLFVKYLFEIIGDNCSDVKSIDLSSNNIQTLECFKGLISSTPFLENLSLMDNPIKSFSEINYLNGLRSNLRELYLQNLNLLNQVKGIKQCYIFEVIRIFPLLRLLDGETLSHNALIGFGTDLDSVISSSFNINNAFNVHNICSELQQSPMITQFIEKYYELFDNNKRRKLFNLYHSDSVFTLTYTPNTDTPTPAQNRSNDHRTVNTACNRINRNLIDDIFLSQARYRQMSKVKHGNCDITKYLSSDFVQKTKHQINYMAIDCHPIKLNDKQFMNVVINGYYAENKDVARKFNRTWLLMQEMNGIIIVNDELHIGGVIPQTKLVKHAPASCQADIKKKNNKNTDLIQQVANHCKCPINISQQALEASNWDPQVAVTKIETLKSQRNIKQ